MSNEIIDKTNLKRVYLLFGDEPYLVHQNERMIVETVISQNNMAEMNHSVYKENVTYDAIISDCNMLPFMSEYRLVQVKDSGLFYQGKKDDTEKLAEYIAKIPDTTVLLFTEKKVDKRNALYKMVKKTGVCTEYNALKPRELVDFVKEKSYGKLQCAEYFISAVGNSMERLTGELDKLRHYCGENPITKQDVDTVCSKTPDAVVFNMVAAVGKRDTAKALSVYNNMLQAKESPFGILKMLARQFKLILECKYMSNKGKNRMEIAQTLGIAEFMVKEYIEQGRNFKISDLINAINACYKCDEDIKLGRMSDTLAVEMIILKMNF